MGYADLEEGIVELFDEAARRGRRHRDPALAFGARLAVDRYQIVRPEAPVPWADNFEAWAQKETGKARLELERAAAERAERAGRDPQAPEERRRRSIHASRRWKKMVEGEIRARRAAKPAYVIAPVENRQEPCMFCGVALEWRPGAAKPMVALPGRRPFNGTCCLDLARYLSSSR